MDMHTLGLPCFQHRISKVVSRFSDNFRTRSVPYATYQRTPRKEVPDIGLTIEPTGFAFFGFSDAIFTSFG
jgi:hypothetical protein